MSSRDKTSRQGQSSKDQAGQHRVEVAGATGAGNPSDVATLSLFCFPYAGGGEPVFRRWQEGMSANVKIHAVALPGRGRLINAPAARRIGDAVNAVIDEIGPHLDGRFAFFGHSMGALLSFEVARALRAQRGLEPVALYAAAQPAPHLPNRRPSLHELSDAELRIELRRMGGTPPEVLANDEFMALLLPTLRADFEVCETYTYAKGARLSCPIVTFGGEDDPEVQEEDLKAWAELTTGTFAFAMLPGGHFFIDHNRQELLAALDASLRLWN